MEYWFVIVLIIIAIVAIAILIFFELLGDDAIHLMKLKHKRGKYINDQTAIICQTIKDTEDNHKAYTLFVEYLFTNHKQFLDYIKSTLREISNSYNSENIPGLEQCLNDAKEMKIELKDQRITQADCIATIDRTIYIEYASWINLADNCRFNINGAIRRIAETCIEYINDYSEPFPQTYSEQLEFLLCDICNICDTCMSLIGSSDIEAMRELRKRMTIILDESYTNTQRLYELIHDGRNEFSKDKIIALKYSLNCFQELHGIIYSIRRFVLANIGLTLSLKQ